MSDSLVLIADDNPDFIAELTKILVDLIKMLASNKGDLKIVAVSEGRQKVLDAAMSLGADAGIKKPPPNTPLDAKLWLDEVFLQIGLG